MNQKHLKLMTKTVSVNTSQISVNVTQEQIRDLHSLVFKSDKWNTEELLHMLREEKRQRMRKERQEKIKEIFGDEFNNI